MTNPPMEDFLAPLIEVAEECPDIEGLVIWAQDGVWPDTSAPVEALEAEEIAFYAEGWLQEGFGITWDILSLPETPEDAQAVRLMIWQGTAPPAPPPPAPWKVLDRQTWMPA